ncbi:ATP-binding protein [Mucilaginibacter agri]|uniref:histidine kinase n=1 Tax=Mucilaginibacter agri TaxID=2695265 RepID=A0A965ZJR9_9SPHI|nr:ATP-binding protein [Mucilaginibacter agri]NCD71945.1 GAF domain-containing protein [Mucilaginibacter agri]
MNQQSDIQADIEAIGQIPIVENLLEVICRSTGMGFAAIARVTEEHWIACSVRDEINFGLIPGGELKLETTICHEIRQSGREVIIDHVADDPQFCTHHTPAMYGFQSYISMPIIRKDGSFFGTLCAIDPRPAKLQNPQTINMFKLFADLIAFHLNAIEQMDTEYKNISDERRDIERREIFNRELEAANRKLAETKRELQAAVTRLTESEEKLLQAIETGRMGTWSIDPATTQVTMSGFIKEMFGFPTDSEPSMEEIMDAVDPDYRQMLIDVLSNAISNHQSSDTEYPITNRLTNERKWVKATGRVFLDANGNATEYSGVLMDITERKTDDLRKNDFIGMVSHELKTPLTSLGAYIQMLYAKAQKTEDVFTANALEKANTQVKKMGTMINGFLNVSRLESGKIQLLKMDFRLDELVKEVIAEISLVNPSHNIIFLPCQPLTINADSDKIGNVLSNLLSNAIKYSPKGKNIEVVCQMVDDYAQVSVHDQGMGIKPHDIEKLFNRFYRVNNKHTQHISGFGIGLYLSAEIIERHDGKIWVESESGVGSTFYFSLPLAG